MTGGKKPAERLTFSLYSKIPGFTGVEKFIAMDKNLFAHYIISRFADRR